MLPMVHDGQWCQGKISHSFVKDGVVGNGERRTVMLEKKNNKHIKTK